jgi:hypothetical protein
VSRVRPTAQRAAKEKSRSGEVDVVGEPLPAGIFQQAHQGRTFGRSILATEQNNQAMMRLGLGQRDKIVTIARNDD